MLAPLDPTYEAGLIRDWTFFPTRPSARMVAARARHLLRRVDPPQTRVLKEGEPGDRWVAYFVYTTTGDLNLAHHFTLDRLTLESRKILIVCAAPSPYDVPHTLLDYADALVWKALPGFDFSAYRVALRYLARRYPGSDVIILNDSVFGPFGALDSWFDTPWTLTGLTATPNVENHIQSYCFGLRDVTMERLAPLSSIFGPTYDIFWPVVYNQETRFARVANRTMSVGSAIYSSSEAAPDPTLQLALPMVDAGFPFLKRSLLGKLSYLHPRETVLATLEAAGHPLP